MSITLVRQCRISSHTHTRARTHVRTSVVLNGGYLGDCDFISHAINQPRGKRDVLGLYCLVTKGSSESGT